MNTVETVERHLADINELMGVFRRHVTNGESAYISFEFRDGFLKYYNNNAEKGPSRQPHHDKPPDLSKPPPRRPNTPATAAPTSPLAALCTPAVVREQLLASTPAGTGAVTRRAAKRKKGVTPPGQDHVPHPTTSPEAARGAAEIDCLQVSLLSLTDHERVHGVSSNQDTPDCDDGGDDEDEGEDDDDEDEEEVEVESDHFSNNIFSALLTTPDAAVSIPSESADKDATPPLPHETYGAATATTTDKPVAFSKYSLGVCDHCIASCKWVACGMSICACCHLGCEGGPLDCFTKPAESENELD